MSFCFWSNRLLPAPSLHHPLPGLPASTLTPSLPQQSIFSTGVQVTLWKPTEITSPFLTLYWCPIPPKAKVKVHPMPNKASHGLVLQVPLQPHSPFLTLPHPLHGPHSEFWHMLLPLHWTFTPKYPRGCLPHLPQVPSSRGGLPWPFHTEPWHSSPPWLLGPSFLCSPENRASAWQSLDEYLLHHWRNDASQCPRPPAQTQRNNSPSVPWSQHSLTLGSRVCLTGGESRPGKKENCSLDHPNLLKAREVRFNGKCQRVW